MVGAVMAVAAREVVATVGVGKVVGPLARVKLAVGMAVGCS